MSWSWANKTRGVLGMVLLLTPPLLSHDHPSVKRDKLPTQQEALKLAFPGCEFVRKDYFLEEDQGEGVRKLCGVKLQSLWVIAYEARNEGALQGVAFFDTHTLRTERGTAMVALSPEGVVRRVEVVSFKEPWNFLPEERWLQQFEGSRLDESKKSRTLPISGATLTAFALQDAAKRCMALHRVLYPTTQVANATLGRP
jgi:hypothetical protein